MPPVRWKTFQVIVAIFIVHLTWNSNAEETISMTSDGWRPIVGTQKEPVYHDEIKYYRNPSFLSETVKAETTTPKPTTSTTTATSPKPLTTSIPNGKINVYNSGTNGQILRGKIPPHSKHSITNHFYVLPKHGSHGPHIPLRGTTQNGKFTSSGKIHTYLTSGGKRHPKPVRVPVGAHSLREEIFLAAPSGPHSFYKGQNVVKVRETQGLGIPGAPIKQYHLQHQPALEFGNQFSLQNDVFQNYNPVHNFVPRPTQQNDNHFSAHNDEYTRNLVPPPFVPKKQNKPTTHKPVAAATTERSTTKNLQFNVQKYTPQSFDVQFTPPHETQQQQFNPNKEKTVELQVTKEKLQVFHNTVPPNHHFQQDFSDYRTRNQGSVNPPHLQTYEVTEGKFWQDTPNIYRQQQFVTAFPETAPQKKRPSLTELQPPTQESADIPFLPTPFQPEGLPPTSPTQSEVSTIFTRLSLKQKAQATDPSLYDVKEVSTHYPILGSPVQEVVTTAVPDGEAVTTPEVEVTEVPVVVRQRVKQRRRRPGHRLRTTTEEVVPVTENYEVEKTVDAPPLRRPLRRRPIRYRTTTTTTTTSPVVEEEEEVENQQIYKRPPQRFRIQTTEEPTTQEVETQSPDQATERTDDDVRNEIDESYNSVPQTTPMVEPFDYADKTEEPVTEREIYKESYEETTLATTAATTTTTEAAVSKPQTRRRPIKYDTNRPRFSVKEYRQRLNQYSSTTTTEAPKTSSEAARTRYVNRFRRPTTTSASVRSEETTEATKTKQRYSNTEEAIITDKPVKAVNTRLRPFGRYRSTTEATTTTQKVSIRPYTFNSLRRPTPISLRKRIYSKLKNNTEEVTTTTTTSTTTEAALNTIEDENSGDAELSETIETALHAAEPDENSTEFDSKKLTDVEISDESEDETTATNDIMKNDSILQRVSDLTSSAKDTPGLFKSVAPTSRRVPSYFTIATDDPILPIETFFANIKDKDRSRF